MPGVVEQGLSVSVNALLWIAGAWGLAVSGGIIGLMVQVAALRAALQQAGIIKGGA